MEHRLTLRVLDGTFAVCRLGSEAAVPGWVLGLDFFSITRTRDELSVVAPEGALRGEALAALAGEARVEGGWACLAVAGPLDLSSVGVLSGLSGALARAGVPVFAISTYDTDYLLVRNETLAEALAALSEAGYGVTGG